MELLPDFLFQGDHACPAAGRCQAVQRLPAEFIPSAYAIGAVFAYFTVQVPGLIFGLGISLQRACFDAGFTPFAEIQIKDFVALEDKIGEKFHHKFRKRAAWQRDIMGKATLIPMTEEGK